MTETPKLAEIKPTELTDIAREFLEEARVIAESGDIGGYALFAFNKDFENRVMFNTGGIIPASLLPAYAEGVLRERVTVRNMELNGHLNYLPEDE